MAGFPVDPIISKIIQKNFGDTSKITNSIPKFLKKIILIIIMTLFLWIAFWHMEKAISKLTQQSLKMSLQFWGTKIFHIDFPFSHCFEFILINIFFFKKLSVIAPFPQAMRNIKLLWDWSFPSEGLRLWSLKCKSWQVYTKLYEILI